MREFLQSVDVSGRIGLSYCSLFLINALGPDIYNSAWISSLQSSNAHTKYKNRVMQKRPSDQENAITTTDESWFQKSKARKLILHFHPKVIRLKMHSNERFHASKFWPRMEPNLGTAAQPTFCKQIPIIRSNLFPKTMRNEALDGVFVILWSFFARECISKIEKIVLHHQWN